jgi:rubrerythrin
MPEEISLDAIESNRDEAPDYRHKLKDGSQGLGTPAGTDDRVYRVRQIASLEAEEKSRYDEFARVAEKEGLKKIAGVFRNILREETGHAGDLPVPRTAANVRTSIGREKEKIAILRRMAQNARGEGDFAFAENVKKMIAEEEGHVKMLEAADEELSEKMRGTEPKVTREEETFCEFGTCVTNPKRTEGRKAPLATGDY